jgi:hypothetical protein
MNRRIWSATCGAVVCATTAALLAQTPPPAQSTQSASSKPITVAGCLKRADTAPTGTTGTAGTAASAAAMKFLLTNAAISASGATSATSQPATSVASEYKLDADDAKLTPHVGHKVEITGVVDAARSMSQPPAASAANAPILKVDNVKMVAATCP